MPTPTEQKTQSLSNLGKSASLAHARTDVTTPVPPAKGGALQGPVTPEGLSVTFFFDGTGNNLPSDPRVIYIGADNKLPYAMNKLPGRGLPTSALG